MARNYFDVRDREGFHPDEFGDEFDSFGDARDQAQALLPAIACEELPGGELHTITCDMRNETGRVVYRGVLTYRGELL